MPNHTSNSHSSQEALDVSTSRPVDFNFENHGSLCLLRPLTQSAADWANEHIGRDNGFQPYWPTVVIEPRYCDDILESIASGRLTVRA